MVQRRAGVGNMGRLLVAEGLGGWHADSLTAFETKLFRAEIGYILRDGQ
jgi:hypothetical protein